MLWESKKIVDLNHFFFFKNASLSCVVDKMLEVGDVDDKVRL